MKRVYAITVLILMAFSIPCKGYGAVTLSYHDRDLSAWAKPDYQTRHYELLGGWVGSISATGTTDTASAEQSSGIYYTPHTYLEVSGEAMEGNPATGGSSVSGTNAEAFSQIMVDFVVNEGDMIWNIDYELTGDNTFIQLWDNWNWSGTPEVFYNSGSGTGTGTLTTGTYRLAVGTYNDGTFETIFTVSEIPIILPCPGDFDFNNDGNVDGSDLAALANGVFDENDLAAFVSEFGRMDCGG